MAVGQGAFAPVLDVGALNAVEARLEVSAVDDCARHGVLLRDVRELHRVLSAAGAAVSTTAQVGLLRQVSEQTAQALLAEAELLSALPGGLEALDCGLLTVEQSTVLSRLLAPLDAEVQQQVWVRVQARLLAALDGGAVLPPARFATMVREQVIAADPREAVERRKAAEAEGDVEYRQRDDSLADIFALGLTGPNAQAVLQRIRSRAQSFGPDDTRSAGKRRLDAFVNLLLGRDQLPLDLPADPTRDEPAAAPVAYCGPSCGCRLDSPVPCGTDVSLLLPLGAALGTTDEVATLAGHGPLEPDLTRFALLSAPRIRPVWVDEDGVPVAVGEQVHVPPRGDPAALQELLLRLAQAPAPPPQPRHPDDHPAAPAARAGPAGRDGPQLLTRPHPAGTPGPYRPPRWLRRLVQVRAPRCEWPGCGVRATRCDVDHDLGWPYGPTCACNCGPLCRRHHRVKQALMVKTRRIGSAVSWTDPTGRSWTSPGQNQPPAPAVRALPALPVPEQHCLSPQALVELLADLLDHPDLDPARFELRAPDLQPDEPDHDRTADRIVHDTGWGLALDDPYRWAA